MSALPVVETKPFSMMVMISGMDWPWKMTAMAAATRAEINRVGMAGNRIRARPSTSTRGTRVMMFRLKMDSSEVRMSVTVALSACPLWEAPRMPKPMRASTIAGPPVYSIALM